MSLEKASVFPREEFTARLRGAHDSIASTGIDALLALSPHNLFYLTGYETIGYSSFQTALVTAGAEPHLFVRELELEAARALGWMAGDPTTYSDDEEPIAALAGLLKGRGLDRSRIGLDLSSAFLSARRLARLIELLPDCRVEDVGPLIERQRRVKSAAELRCLRAAAGYAEAGIFAAIAAIHEGALDNEVGAAAADAVYRAGSEYVASGPTVTTGRRSGVAHTTFHRTVVETGDVVLLEIGGVHNRYTSALMRTASLGAPPVLATRMYDACRRALDAALEAIRPGTRAGDVHDAAQREIDKAGFTTNYRKRLGYSIGISFAPGWGEGHFLELSAGDQTPLEAGMVFHIPPALREPGVLGVGCSETIVVTETGADLLTNYPQDLAIC